MTTHTPETEHYTRIDPTEWTHAHPECGCRLERGDDATVSLYQCPTHAAAPALLAVQSDTTAVLDDLLADYIAECHRSYNLAKRPGRFYGEDMPLVKRARKALDDARALLRAVEG